MFARVAISRRRTEVQLLGIVLLLAGVVSLAGCSHVIGYNSPYYKNGPAQREGPQGTIPAGTPVWVLGKDGSYTHVWASNGVDGYVWDTSIVTSEEWNRRQSLQKQNQEIERRARAKGNGPLGAPQDAEPSQGPKATPSPGKSTTPAAKSPSPPAKNTVTPTKPVTPARVPAGSEPHK